jgi:hypothetical protein
MGVVLMLMSSCEKRSYDHSPVNEPVFFIAYEENGQQVVYTAGDHNLYMHTSKAVTTEGVPMAMGVLGPVLPSMEGSSWTLGLTSPNQNVFSMDAFLPGNRTLYSVFNTRRSGADFSLRLVPLPADSLLVTEYIWRIDAQGTTFTSTQNPVITIDEAITPKITVTLTTIYQNGCRDDIQHVIDFSNITARSDFQILQASPMSYTFQRHDPRPVHNDSIVWFINNIQQASGPSFSNNFSQTGQYKVTMRTNLEDGYISETTRDVFVNNQMASGCHSNFTFELTSAGELDFFQKNRVLVEYTDSTGNRFSSKPITTEQTISIDGFEYFYRNNNNEPTVKVRLSGDFDLEDANGNKKSIKSFNGYFGMALPN